MILTARYVVPVEAPVIENGAVAVRDGKIEAVGPRREVRGEPILDYGDAVICPGFVNAHTHLELSALAGSVPPSPDFTDWLMRLTDGAKRKLSDRAAHQRSVSAGIAESLKNGVTCVGDITRAPAWTRDMLARSPLCGVSFGEVAAIGKRRHLFTQRLDAAVLPIRGEHGFCGGISPHAPYTLEPDGLRACAERADAMGLPLCMHLLETLDEVLFTRRCEGPFADLLRTLDVWDEDIPMGGLDPLELTAQCGLLGRRTILAHVNYASDADIAKIAESGSSVAYCPRTHRAFGHPPHRFEDMDLAGVNVCIGTDSLASNPSLSVLDELRFLRGLVPDLPPDDLLAMGTIHGARALGLAEAVGSIVPGKRADLVVCLLEHSTPKTSWEGIFVDDRAPAAVYAAGEPLPH